MTGRVKDLARAIVRDLSDQVLLLGNGFPDKSQIAAMQRSHADLALAG